MQWGLPLLHTFKQTRMNTQRKNTKKVEIIVPDEQTLMLVNRTPALNRLSRLRLKVGQNFEVVNHKQYFDMNNIYPSIGISVKEVTI